MWDFTKCTAEDRDEKLKRLTASFHHAADCLKYLSEVQNHINSTSTTIVLLQDLTANVLIEMDYVPINNYKFRVIGIEKNGLKKKSLFYMTIEQAVNEFSLQVKKKS